MGFKTETVLEGKRVTLWVADRTPSELDELEYTDPTSGKLKTVKVKAAWAGDLHSPCPAGAIEAKVKTR